MSPRLLRVLALLSVLAGACVRLHGLGADSFDAKEIAQIRAAEMPASGALRSSAPVPTLITRLALRWGYDESTVRLPSALGGVATVGVVWRLAATLFGPEVALYAAAMTAFSPFLVGLSRTAGPTVWLALLAAVTVLLFERATTTAEGVGRWGMIVIVAVLGCLSGYAMLLVVAAVLVSAVVLAVYDRSMTRAAVRAAIAAGVVGGLAALWILYNPQGVPRSLLRVRADWPSVIATVATGASGGTGARGLAVVLFGVALLGTLSRGLKVRGGLVVWWAVVGFGGLVVADWWVDLPFDAMQVGFALAAYCVLVGAGLGTIREAVSRRIPRWTVAPAQAAALIAVGLSQLPAVAGHLHQARPQWREIAAIVRENVQPKDVVVAVLERDSFVFYAPDLERRVEPAVSPGRSTGYFVSADRGWLIAPAAARVYPGWKKLNAWLARFPPVDVSPDDTVSVFYMGRGGRDKLLLEAAFFDLPASSLVRGTLLFEFLQRVGPLPPVLWKVDQIALSRQPLELRNPELLNAVYYLAEHGHGDRAASLIYRLATAEPDWEEAQRALAAFRPAAHAGPGF